MDITKKLTEKKTYKWKIVIEILKIENAKAESKEELSPECRNPFFGRIINYMNHFHDKTELKKPVDTDAPLIFMLALQSQE